MKFLYFSRNSEAPSHCFVVYRIPRDAFHVPGNNNVTLNELTATNIPWGQYIGNTLEVAESLEAAEKFLIDQNEFSELKNQIPLVIKVDPYSKNVMSGLYNAEYIEMLSDVKSIKYLPTGLFKLLEEIAKGSNLKVCESKLNSDKVSKQYVIQRLKDIEMLTGDSLDVIKNVLVSAMSAERTQSKFSLPALPVFEQPGKDNHPLQMQPVNSAQVTALQKEVNALTLANIELIKMMQKLTDLVNDLQSDRIMMQKKLDQLEQSAQQVTELTCSMKTLQSQNLSMQKKIENFERAQLEKEIALVRKAGYSSLFSSVTLSDSAGKNAKLDNEKAVNSNKIVIQTL